MQKREASFTTKFLSWAQKNMVAPAVFEIKSTRGRSVFPVFELRKHQRNALMAAKNGCFTYKIPDSALGYKPFDATLYGNMEAYVVVEYPKHAFVIPIDVIPTTGSMTVEKARSIASLELTASLMK